MKTVQDQCRLAATAARDLGASSTLQRNGALEAMAAGILASKEAILTANEADIKAAHQNKIEPALIDRLRLTSERLDDIAQSLRDIAALPDPLGEVLSGWIRPNGLKIQKIRVPLGVIGMIYEARPNVTADAAGLAIKTGNCVVLRGSSSAYQSNLAIATVLKAACKEEGLSEHCIELLEDTSRESVQDFIKMDQYLSVIIPRGGAGLIQSVVKSASVPTIETGVGNCHVYIDTSADREKAISIALNAKTHRPSVCNSMESLLIHQDIAPDIIKPLFDAYKDAGVELRGCPRTVALDDSVTPASESDWGEEFLSLILSVKIVDSVDEAIDHILQYGSKHTEAIVAQDSAAINRFKQQIDASTVIANASTRFTDGGEFGFGAEVGISTQKLHARGPMGLPELTSYKYIVDGEGQIR